MGLMEWSFVTATPYGAIISIDGSMVNEGTVTALCKAEGWEIEHSAFASNEHLDRWHLILSRPFAQARPTASNLDDAVMIGAA